MKQLSLNRPHIIVMVGIPGSGKSAFAEHFASTFDAPIVSGKRMRASFKGSDIPEQDLDQVVSLMQMHTLTELFKTKSTIVYDGDSGSRSRRKALIDYATKFGYEPLIVWTQTDTTTSRERFVKSSRSKRGQSELADKFDKQSKIFTPPNDSEKYVVISGKHTYPSQLKVVLRKLAEPRAGLANAASRAATPVRNRSGTR
jgi:predicted kinase